MDNILGIELNKTVRELLGAAASTTEKVYHHM